MTKLSFAGLDALDRVRHRRPLRGLDDSDARSARAADPYTTAVPVNLNGQVVMNPGDTGAAIGSALKNPLPVPLELHELKWGLAAMVQVVSGVAVGTVSLSGIAVEAAIRYGAIPITAAPIPLAALSRQVNSRNENNAFTGASNGTFIADQYATVFGRIKFDEPIYLLPGEQLDVALNHRSLISSPITANISLSGRGVRSIPRHRKLPYWAQFTPQAFAIDQAQANAPLRADSTPDDLVNRSGAELTVRRLIGRVMLSSVGSIGDSPDARELVLVQMRDSHGLAIVKDATPFGVVFPPPTFALEVMFQLQKDDFLLSTLTTQGFTNAATQFRANTSIAMLGYRAIE